MKIMAIDYGDARTGVAIAEGVGGFPGQPAVNPRGKPEVPE